MPRPTEPKPRSVRRPMEVPEYIHCKYYWKRPNPNRPKWQRQGPVAKYFRNAADWDKKHHAELMAEAARDDPWKYFMFKPDPPKPLPPRKLDLSHLEKVLEADKLAVRDHLDVSEVRALFAREESANSLRLKEWEEDTVVLGESLLKSSAMHHAIGRWGNDVYDIPAMVYAAIEQLYRTALDEPNLFGVAPDEKRTNHLLTFFDQPYTPDSKLFFDKAFSVCLEGEATPNLCAIVTTYLYSLPDPVIDRCFQSAFWMWCVLPTIRREKQRATSGLQPYTDVEWYNLEVRQVATARALVRLLPRPTVGLLTYLLNFIAEALQHPKNGLTLAYLVDMLPRPLFGRADAQSKHLVVWLVTRWQRIHNGLFGEPHPSVEDLFGKPLVVAQPPPRVPPKPQLRPMPKAVRAPPKSCARPARREPRRKAPQPPPPPPAPRAPVRPMPGVRYIPQTKPSARAERAPLPRPPPIIAHTESRETFVSCVSSPRGIHRV